MRALLPFLAAAVLCQNVARAQDVQPLFKSGATVVRVDVQVDDSGRLVNELTRDDFRIFDENTPQPMTHFGHEREPVSLLLLLDVSGSMTKSIDALARSSRQAMAVLKPDDKLAVMLFARNQKVTQEFTGDFEAVSRQINSAVNDKGLGSGTLINHAVVAAAEYMKENAATGRRAILVVTDNLGLNYQLNDEQTLKKLHGANTVLNAIVTGRARRPEPDPKGRYTNPDFTLSNVFSLSEETGGEAFRPGNLESSLGLIFDRIRNRYALEYSAPPTGAPGAFHKIRVTLSPEAQRRYPKAQLRARVGYYAAE